MDVKMNVASTLLLVLTSAVIARAQSDRVHADALLDLLVFGPRNAWIDPTAYPRPVQTRLRAYLTRFEALERRRPTKPPPHDPEEEMVQDARSGYAHRLAAFSSERNAERLAYEYVDELRPGYEDDGRHEGPVIEAQFAEKYLENHLKGPFGMFLPLLAAHRWICAAEAYSFEHDPEGERRARAAYALMLARARRSLDPMIRAAANALMARGMCLPQ